MATLPNMNQSSSVSSCPELFKPNSKDIGWRWNSLKDKDNKKRVTCDFCKVETTAGITQAKQHQMGVKGNVALCPLTPEDVKMLLRENEEKRVAAKDGISGEPSQMLVDDDEVELQEISRLQSGKRPIEEANLRPAKKSAKGPLDKMFFKKTDVTSAKTRQTSMNNAYSKEAREKVCQIIARFFFKHGIAFNVAKSKSFDQMVQTIGHYGPNLKPPSYHELRVPLLKKELEHTHEILKSHKEQQAKYGCSIMSDGWTDGRSRTLINFLVNSRAGTMFVKSVDASEHVKDGMMLFQLLDNFVEEIGESNVVQLITDNRSNYVLAGKYLVAKRPRMFWTPCAAHCLDLILEDIGKIPKVKKVVQKGIKLVGFIYNHSLVLSLMRKNTGHELVRAGVTRFASMFLTLKSLKEQKSHLRKMFTSEEWNNLKASKETKGNNAAGIVLQTRFWDDVLYALRVMGPLVAVLRLVDNEKKPAMGYIYQAMEKAREFIRAGLHNDESKYKEILAIVDNRWKAQLHHPLHAAGHYLNPAYFYSDPTIANNSLLLNGLYECVKKLTLSDEVFDVVMRELTIYKNAEGFFGKDYVIRHRKEVAPAEWWDRYGSETPNLQLFAMKILTLTCSSLGCERNWSTFDHIHSKKRNRLEHKMLHDLVFVKYNQTLKENHNNKDKIDPLQLDDIDTSNEWLLGDEICEGGDDVVYEDGDLSWLDVELASGAAEPRVNTRSQARPTPIPTPPPPPPAQPPSSETRSRTWEVEEDDEDDEDGNRFSCGGSDDKDFDVLDV